MLKNNINIMFSSFENEIVYFHFTGTNVINQIF